MIFKERKVKLDVFFHVGESLKLAVDAIQNRAQNGGNGVENALRKALTVLNQHTGDIAAMQAQAQESNRRISELEALVSALSQSQQPPVVEPSLPAGPAPEQPQQPQPEPVPQQPAVPVLNETVPGGQNPA